MGNDNKRSEGKRLAYAYNTKTGAPVRLNDAPQVGLTRAVAAEVMQTLNGFKPEPEKSERE